MNRLIPAREQWLGLVANGWRRSRIRNEAILSPGISSCSPAPDEMCTLVPMEQVSEEGVIVTSNVVAFEDVHSSLVPIEAGDVIFAKITPCMENGKGAFIDSLPTRYAYGSTEFHVLRPSPQLNGRFLYYYTFNPVYRAYAAENMTGAAGQKRVSSRFLKDTRLFVPPIDEQLRISAYLDASCRIIDSAVEAKRMQIASLDEQREAVIEVATTRGLDPSAKLIGADQDWLENIPSHWKAVRIKRVLSRMDYGVSESTSPEDGFPVLKMGNLQNGEIRFTNIEFVEKVDPGLILETNDVLYNRTNSSDQVGKAAIFRGRKEDGVTFASYLVRLRANHRILAEYLNYVVNCSGFLSFARKLAIPSVQQSNLNSTRYGRIFIPLPPLPEQRAICGYLAGRLARLDDVKGVVERQVITLTAYRNALIHDCVTGQRRITEEDVNRVITHAATLA